MQRRTFLRDAGLGAIAGLALTGAAGGTGDDAAGEPFDYERLIAEARDLARLPFRQRGDELPPELAALDWDRYHRIRFRRQRALWYGLDLPFRVEFAHLGIFFRRAVHLFELVDGRARPIAYDPAMFDYGPNRFEPPLPADLGFAGFRLHYHTDFEPDVAVFQGASYFRAVDAGNQFGMSARGLAIDTGLDRPEEFPDFTHFWLVRPRPDDTALTVLALLESPSVTGAYRFRIAPGARTVMDVEARLFARAAIERLGIAPLTSMYQCGENDRRVCDDWRPEIHDSDGLSILNGMGEWIWRPLVNPHYVRVTSFADRGPRGFGLMQRDRAFDSYQDDGARYHLRPGVWVEPLGDWGPGVVMLVEIPTADETFDNIVAFWKPDRPVVAGDELALRYRLHWGRGPSAPVDVAQVVATRSGRAGLVGHPEPPRARKFVVEFEGGKLPLLGESTMPEPVLRVSHGHTTAPSVDPERAPQPSAIWRIAGTDRWRVVFDYHWQQAAPVDIKLFLRLGREVLSESWTYLFDPPA